MIPSEASIPHRNSAQRDKPRFFIYTPDSDYYLGPRHSGWRLPTEELTPADAASADFFLIPEDLRLLQIDLGFAAVRKFAESLPFFHHQPERHIFWSSHDDPRSPVPEAIFCKTSVNKHEPGKFISVPYQTDDLGSRCHFDALQIKWQTCFVGYPGSSPLREELLLAIAASKVLSSHLDIASKFHWHLDAVIQRERRENYLNTLAASLTALCPRGEGMNSIRFFETLSIGRIPILMADDYPLPFEELIPYHRFVISIAEHDCLHADHIINSWLADKTIDDLMQRCREARQTWERLLAPDKVMGCLQQVLVTRPSTGSIEPDTSASSHQKGLDAYLTGDPEAAEQFFQYALKANPQRTESAYCLALLYNELGRFQDCIKLLVDTTASHHDTRLNRLLGEAYQQTEQWTAAWQQFSVALTEEPHNAQLLMNMGIVCSRLNRMHDALTWLSRSTAVEPALAQAHMNLGCVLQSLNRIEDATHTLRAAVSLAPDYGTARWNLAQLLLLQGNFEEGLALFEARFSKYDPVLLPETEVPHWQGEPLNGKTIIISTEQAFGDAIQFVRYLPLLAQKGARVILYNHLKPLQQLFQSVPGISAVVTEKAQIPAADYFLPMLSLPRLFATGLDSIPSRMIPYLAPRPEKLHQWQQRVSSSSRMKIGLCWAGRNTPDPRRSARLDDFAPLSAFPETIFYSLQLGEGSEQAMTPPEGMALIDFTKDIDDFEDTAALLLQLDLVITIDTSVAHLAGALGRPVFTLLPYAPDWRWLLERDDCPWYPTMRLFRQKAPGDWTHPISRIVSCYSTLFPHRLC